MAPKQGKKTMWGLIVRGGLILLVETEVVAGRLDEYISGRFKLYVSVSY